MVAAALPSASSRLTPEFLRSAGRLLAVTAFLGCLLWIADDVQATHFRGGSLSWEPTGAAPNEVHFFGEIAKRAGSTSPTPTVGALVLEDGQLFFGDGTWTPLKSVSITYNSAEDWYVGQLTDPMGAPITHKYPAPNNGGAPWVAFLRGYCRTDVGYASYDYENMNNPCKEFLMETDVDLAAPNRSPVNSFQPLILCPLPPATTCTFTISGTDPDGDPLHHRLSITPEPGAAFAQPPGPPAIDPTTGVVTWNTAGIPMSATHDITQYSMQVMLEDGKTRVASDFIIEFRPFCTPGGINLGSPALPSLQDPTSCICSPDAIHLWGDTLDYDVTVARAWVYEDHNLKLSCGTCPVPYADLYQFGEVEETPPSDPQYRTGAGADIGLCIPICTVEHLDLSADLYADQDTPPAATWNLTAPGEPDVSCIDPCAYTPEGFNALCDPCRIDLRGVFVRPEEPQLPTLQPEDLVAWVDECVCPGGPLQATGQVLDYAVSFAGAYAHEDHNVIVGCGICPAKYVHIWERADAQSSPLGASPQYAWSLGMDVRTCLPCDVQDVSLYAYGDNDDFIVFGDEVTRWAESCLPDCEDLGNPPVLCGDLCSENVDSVICECLVTSEQGLCVCDSNLSVECPCPLESRDPLACLLDCHVEIHPLMLAITPDQVLQDPTALLELDWENVTVPQPVTVTCSEPPPAVGGLPGTSGAAAGLATAVPPPAIAPVAAAPAASAPPPAAAGATAVSQPGLP